LPDPVAFVSDVSAGRIDPVVFDFEKAGYWQLDRQQRDEWRMSLLFAFSNPEGVNPNGLAPAVLDPAADCDDAARRRHLSFAWSAAAVRAESAREWRQAFAELQARQARLDDAMDSAAAAVEGSSLAPRVRDLQRRAARDRVVHTAVKEEGAWGAGLSHTAQFAWHEVARTRMAATVCDNSAWLVAQVRDHGWFDARQYGTAADAAAWQLLRSTDDFEFMKSTLRLVMGLPKAATSQKQVALIYDYVAWLEGRPQRFGSRRHCVYDGSSELSTELEEPARVNQRRAAVGLEPIDPAPLVKDPNCPHPGY
jgi:hypothetical protein